MDSVLAASAHCDEVHPRSGSTAGRQNKEPWKEVKNDSADRAFRGFASPDGARVAVVATCLMENWSGDKGPPFSVQTTSLKPGTHDRAAMTWGTYGSRYGVWRLLKILTESRRRATFVANAHSMEIAPEAVECMLKTGHEIAGHSYTQDALIAYLEPDAERALIEK